MGDKLNFEPALEAYSKLAEFRSMGYKYPNFSIMDVLDQIAIDKYSPVNMKRSVMMGLVSMAGSFNWLNPFEFFAPKSKYSIHGQPLNDQSGSSEAKKLPTRLSGNAFLNNLNFLIAAYTGNKLQSSRLTTKGLSPNEQYLLDKGFGFIQEHSTRVEELIMDDHFDVNSVSTRGVLSFNYTPGYRYWEKSVQRWGGITKVTDNHLQTGFVLHSYYANPQIRPEGFESFVAGELTNKKIETNYQAVTGIRESANCLKGKSGSIVSAGFNNEEIHLNTAMTHKFCNETCPLFKQGTCGVLLHRSALFLQDPNSRKEIANQAQQSLMNFRSQLI